MQELLGFQYLMESLYWRDPLAFCQAVTYLYTVAIWPFGVLQQSAHCYRYFTSYSLLLIREQI